MVGLVFDILQLVFLGAAVNRNNHGAIILNYQEGSRCRGPPFTQRCWVICTGTWIWDSPEPIANEYQSNCNSKPRKKLCGVSKYNECREIQLSRILRDWQLLLSSYCVFRVQQENNEWNSGFWSFTILWKLDSRTPETEIYWEARKNYIWVLTCFCRYLAKNYAHFKQRTQWIVRLWKLVCPTVNSRLGSEGRSGLVLTCKFG